MTFSKRSFFAASLLAITFLSGHTAQAGFQWTAPVGGAAATAPRAPSAATPRVPAAPVASVDSEALPNALGDLQSGPSSNGGQTIADDPISWNTPRSAGMQNMQKAAAKTMPQNAPQSVLPVESTALYATNGAPTAGAAVNDAIASRYDIANGFGRDLPVVMAIRQIVPAQYGFVFDDGIDLSSRVSWQGGKPWDIVLQETLTPLGLTASIHGSVVTVTRGGGMRSAGAQMSTQTINDTNTTSMAPAPLTTPVQDMPAAGGYSATPVSATAPAAGAASNMIGSAGPLGSTATWIAPRNSSLRAILEDWCEKAGVEL